MANCGEIFLYPRLKMVSEQTEKANHPPLNLKSEESVNAQAIAPHLSSLKGICKNVANNFHAVDYLLVMDLLALMD